MTFQVSGARIRPASSTRTQATSETQTTPASKPVTRDATRPATRGSVEPSPDSFTPRQSTSRKLDLTGGPQAVTFPIAPKQTESARYVDVPVFPSDTEWDVVRRALPMLAKQAGLSPEGQKVFAETWAAKLHQRGETRIYSNKTGDALSQGDFKSNIKENAPGATSTPAGSVGTYKLEFTPGKHGAMFADLRQLRHNEELTQGIEDPKLRGNVLLELNRLTVGAGDDKAQAAQNLWALAETGKPEADKVYGAIKTLAGSESQKSNAAVKLAELRLDFDRQQQFIGPRDEAGDNARMSARIDDVARLADKRDTTTTGASQGRPDRTEAAWVNKQASIMLKGLGDTRGALHREMVGRFYEMGPEERARFESPSLVKTVPRWAPSDTPSMRATTPQEQALRKFEQQNGPSPIPKKDLGEDPQKLEFTKPSYTLNEKTGELVPSASTRFALDSALRTEGTATVTMNHHLSEKGVKKNPNLPYSRTMKETRKLPFESPVLNPGTVGRMRTTSAGVGAIEEFNKWGSFLGDLYNDTTAKKVADRARLEKSANDALNFPVPPRPEELAGLRPKIEQLYGKEQAPSVMRKLEELSVALYGREPPTPTNPVRR
ncbi:hypothetical protein ACN469_30635 [Corallococcus terminator]